MNLKERITGKELRMIKGILGLSNREIGESICVSQDTVRQWQHRNTKLTWVATLAVREAFGLDDEFMTTVRELTSKYNGGGKHV